MNGNERIEFREIKDEDHLVYAGPEEFMKRIIAARSRALKEGVLANTVVIDKEFARVHKFYPDGLFGRPIEIPDMIAGMKVLFDDLPDERVAMYMMEMDPPPESRIKRLERENRALREKLTAVRRLIERYDEV